VLEFSALGKRAWYAASLHDFHATADDAVIGKLTNQSAFDVTLAQRNAWQTQLAVLRAALHDRQGAIFLEFNIPRMGRRADAIVVIAGVVIVIEFKVGSDSVEASARAQAWDYALDLKNFHSASHSVPIVPIAVATHAQSTKPLHWVIADDLVSEPLESGMQDLGRKIDAVAERFVDSPKINVSEWANGVYKPTPTIIEAARALYADHSVDAIARFDTEAQNLTRTVDRVRAIAHDSHQLGRKSICFVTGVPGAGKTLVGLNIATQRESTRPEEHSVYLSGNDPLVAVLREALTRDDLARRKRTGERITKAAVSEPIKVFIQNVHHFRDEALRQLDSPPVEHVAVFDEAQRAWNATQTSKFMRRRKGVDGFAKSEPEFLIEYLDRHPDWCAVVCLVGGGQEINTGEAGISGWFEALARRFPNWLIYASSHLDDQVYSATEELRLAKARGVLNESEDLHLATSMRAFRSARVSAFVDTLLALDTVRAAELFTSISKAYPVRLSRDLDEAKRWIRGRARGSERFGLVASSKAQRLKPHAIDIRYNVDPIHWFLNPQEDTRSSLYLEDAATEFQVQGLELDWTLVTWDADLRSSDRGWTYHDFRGDKWTHVHKRENQRYLLNAYRVLLTRARQGMVIFVPPGDTSDHTRSPAYYDETYRLLKAIGIPAIGSDNTA
jgi:hypothetical protein